MKTYQYWRAWLLSFYSVEFYKDVGQRWRGTGLWYLFCILVVCLSAFCLVQQRVVNEFVQQVALPIAVQLPEMQIEQGSIHLKSEGTHIIKNPLTGQRLVVIDTTGSIENLAQAQALLLITKNSYSYANLAQQEVIRPLTAMPNITIKQEQLAKILNFLSSKRFWSMAYLIYVIGYWIGYACLILLFAVFAWLCARQLAINLNYVALFRLTVIAFTPIITISLLSAILRLTIPYASLIYLFLITFYIYYAVRANSTAEQAKVVNA